MSSSGFQLTALSVPESLSYLVEAMEDPLTFSSLSSFSSSEDLNEGDKLLLSRLLLLLQAPHGPQGGAQHR